MKSDGFEIQFLFWNEILTLKMMSVCNLTKTMLCFLCHEKSSDYVDDTASHCKMKVGFN